MEFFPNVPKIEYCGKDSKSCPSPSSPFYFRDYNAEQIIQGKPMKEWCRFAVCYWHSFCGNGMDPFGEPTMVNRPWMNDHSLYPLDVARMKADFAFELFTKLGVEYYTFHDVDIAPIGVDLSETNANLDIMAEYLKSKQDATGVKLLWGTANLFSHRRYMNGAGTSPQLHVFAYACAQVKKAMEITHRLGGENFVFWGGREGYQTLLNTDVKLELDHFAQLLRMAVDYKSEIGATFQLLIEPKPREPMKHQYDYDAMTVLAFLSRHGLDKDFKLNIEPNHTTLAGHDYEHDIVMAHVHGALGSIDCNTGDALVGWDTDQFLMDDKKATAVMRVVLEQNGLGQGGLNFDCKVRRESTDIQDLILAHMGSMDCFARGLRNAERLHEKGTLRAMTQRRYSTWHSEVGKAVQAGKTSLHDLEKYVIQHGSVEPDSGQQELFEMTFQRDIE